VTGIFAMMKAAEKPAGMVPADACPVHWAAEAPQNTWALEGRFRASTRKVELPLVPCTVSVLQRWREQHGGRVAQQETDARKVEGHSTAAVCWDGSAVLADFLCHHPAILLSHSPRLARMPSIHAEWRWAVKSVLELGCGIAALPALVTSLQGARSVVCTDANESVLRLTRVNAIQFAQAHPRATTAIMAPLVWSNDQHNLRDQLRAAGVPDATFDVILAADCFYVLDNPGAWGKLLATVAALCTPYTLTFVTYTDRGHNKLWLRFVEQRVSKLFHVVPVQAHLLHPLAQPGARDRLEQHTPECQVFCWTLKEGVASGSKTAAHAPSEQDVLCDRRTASAPPSRPVDSTPPIVGPSLPPSPPLSPPSPPDPLPAAALCFGRPISSWLLSSPAAAAQIWRRLGQRRSSAGERPERPALLANIRFPATMERELHPLHASLSVGGEAVLPSMLSADPSGVGQMPAGHSFVMSGYPALRCNAACPSHRLLGLYSAPATNGGSIDCDELTIWVEWKQPGTASSTPRQGEEDNGDSTCCVLSIRVAGVVITECTRPWGTDVRLSIPMATARASHGGVVSELRWDNRVGAGSRCLHLPPCFPKLPFFSSLVTAAVVTDVSGNCPELLAEIMTPSPTHDFRRRLPARGFGLELECVTLGEPPSAVTMLDARRGNALPASLIAHLRQMMTLTQHALDDSVSAASTLHALRRCLQWRHAYDSTISGTSEVLAHRILRDATHVPAEGGTSDQLRLCGLGDLSLCQGALRDRPRCRAAHCARRPLRHVSARSCQRAEHHGKRRAAHGTADLGRVSRVGALRRSDEWFCTTVGGAQQMVGSTVRQWQGVAVERALLGAGTDHGGGRGAEGWCIVAPRRGATGCRLARKRSALALGHRGGHGRRCAKLPPRCTLARTLRRLCACK